MTGDDMDHESEGLRGKIKRLPVRSSIPGWDDMTTNLGQCLSEAPGEPAWVFRGLLRVGSVGALIAAGGVGKSRLLLHLMLALASGKAFGPFQPVKPMRVLYLAGEDPHDVIHERLYHIARGMGVYGAMGPAVELGKTLIGNLGVAPMFGARRVLVARDTRGNPGPTDVFEEIDAAISNMPPLGLVVIDPLSQFFACDENDNAAGTAWVNAMQTLARNHGAAVLFAHHAGKVALTEEDPMRLIGRGASALHDGVRVMLTITRKPAQALGFPVEGHEAGFLEVCQPKRNYSEAWTTSHYFRDGPGVLLTPTDPQAGLRGRQAEELARLLPPGGLSEREILKEPAGKAIRDGMKRSFPKISIGRELPVVVRFGVSARLITEEFASEKNTNGRGAIRFFPMTRNTN